MKLDEAWEASSSSNRWYCQRYMEGTLCPATLFREQWESTPGSSPDAPRRLPELVASSVFLLKRLGFTAKTRSLDMYEREGLNPYHYAILALLDDGVPETQAAIADALGYDRGPLVGLLDGSRRRPSSSASAIPTTDGAIGPPHGDGKRTLGRSRACAKKVEDEFLAPLDAEQREQLHELLLVLAERHEPRCAPPSSAGSPSAEPGVAPSQSLRGPRAARRSGSGTRARCRPCSR